MYSIVSSQYYATVKKLDNEQIYKQIIDDAKFRREVVLQHLHIVTSYFDARVVNYYSTVMKELVQYDDCWWRYEFAKSRGEIHSHAIVFSSKHAKKIENALQQSEEEQPEALHNWLQTNYCNENNVFSPGFVSMHPAGGSVNNKDGTLSWKPHLQKWAPPEGTAEIPDYNPLQKSITDILLEDIDIKEHYTNLVNKIALHKCNGYCLRLKRKSKNKNTNEDESHQSKRCCRFHFGDQDPKTKKTPGKKYTHSMQMLSTGPIPDTRAPVTIRV